MTPTTLKGFYERNGYVKVKARKKKSNAGVEARISVRPGDELRRLRAALSAAGLEAGRPFAKKKQLRVPIYGRGQVARLLHLVGVRDRRVQA